MGQASIQANTAAHTAAATQAPAVPTSRISGTPASVPNRPADKPGLPACRSATDTIPAAITIANARGSAPRTAGVSIWLGEGGSLVFVAGHELVEDGGQFVQALQVSPGELPQDLVGGQRICGTYPMPGAISLALGDPRPEAAKIG
jgi:hypothetical protein